MTNCKQSRNRATDLPPAHRGPDMAPEPDNVAPCSTQPGHRFPQPPRVATQFWQQFINTLYTQEVAWSCMNQLNYSAPCRSMPPVSRLSINLRRIKLSMGSLWGNNDNAAGTSHSTCRNVPTAMSRFAFMCAALIATKGGAAKH